MKSPFSALTRISPIAYLSQLVGTRRMGGARRGIRIRAEKLGVTRSTGPQNVDQAFQSLLLNSRPK